MKLTMDGLKILLTELSQKKTDLIREINQNATYVMAVSEKEEDVKPDFDFRKVCEMIGEICDKNVALRHQRNVYNATEVVGDTGRTVDEILIELATLTDLCKRYHNLATNPEKKRQMSYSKEIEYQYVNYDIKDAKEIYERLEKERRELQKALDLHNATVIFEFPDVTV